jgi:hypothetical protein
VGGCKSMKLSSLVLTLYPMGPPIVPPNTMLSCIACTYYEHHYLAWWLPHEVYIPIDFPPDTQLAVEPRVDSTSCQSIKSSHAWPQPGILESVGRKLRLVNHSTEPIFIKKNDHICQLASLWAALLHKRKCPAHKTLDPYLPHITLLDIIQSKFP